MVEVEVAPSGIMTVWSLHFHVAARGRDEHAHYSTMVVVPCREKQEDGWWRSQCAGDDLQILLPNFFIERSHHAG